MISGKNNLLMLLLTFLVITGQAMASAVNTCSEGPSKNLLLAAETESDVSHEKVDDHSDICDCCQLDCFCPMGSCVSIVVCSLANNQDSKFISTQITYKAFKALNLTTSSLYRPPIFKS